MQNCRCYFVHVWIATAVRGSKLPYQCAQLLSADRQQPVGLLDGQCRRLLSVSTRHSWQSGKRPQHSQVRLVLSESSQRQEPDLFPFSLLHSTSIKLIATGGVVGGIKHRVAPQLGPPSAVYLWLLVLSYNMRCKLRQSFCQRPRELISHVSTLSEAW